MGGVPSRNQRVMLCARSLFRVRATVLRALAHEPALRDRLASELADFEADVLALVPAAFGGTMRPEASARGDV